MKSSVNKNKALFLDRDGTINIEKNYVYRIEDFEFIPGIFELILSFQKKGYLIFIVTNQAGIARGYYSENDYSLLTAWMINQFKINNIEISKVYYCPHHPEISGECECRKPKPGMILQAITEFNINPNKSILIGDKKSDILAGKKAGIAKNYFINEFLESGRIIQTKF
jgi:D-glycero-D-manno-heptose 1,7-bisphosphate phosphatase